MAVRVTSVDETKLCEQSLPQSIPAGLDATVPDPLPDFDASSRNEGGTVDADWMIVLLPSERFQIAVALPSGAIVTCGSEAFWPAADRSIGVPKAAPGGRVAAWMMLLLPFERLQTTVVVPSGAVVSCVSSAFCPVADRSTGVPKTPAPRVAA